MESLKIHMHEIERKMNTWFSSKVPHLGHGLNLTLWGGMKDNSCRTHNTKNTPKYTKYVKFLPQHNTRKNSTVREMPKLLDLLKYKQHNFFK
jgi:hypothetical protein